VGFITGSFLLSRSLFSRFVRKRAGVLERLLEDLVGRVEEGVEQGQEEELG
jgi:hypothetical protein